MPVSRWRRLRLIAAWCLGLYLAWLYVRMGWIKFDPEGFWTAAFVRWGYPPWMRIAVGAVEVVGGVMLFGSHTNGGSSGPGRSHERGA